MRLTQKKMNMLRHNHISENDQTVSSTDTFKRREKEVASSRDIEEWPALVTTERHKMKIASTVEALWMVRHVPKL